MGVVFGKRVKANGLPAWLAWYGAAAVIIVLSVRNFVGGDTPWGAVFAVAGLIVALAGKALAGDAKRTSEIVSACPSAASIASAASCRCGSSEK